MCGGVYAYKQVLAHLARKLKASSTNWLISIISPTPWLANILSRKINSSDQYPLKRVCMSDLQFCRASLGKSEAWAIIPKLPICRPRLYLVKSKVKLRFWWLHQSSHSRNRRSLRKISKSISSQNKQTKICSERFFISMTEFA
jgi:hypothetical protein